MTTERVPCPHCDGEGIVRNWSMSVDQIDDHRSCPDCLGAGDVPDPVPEANAALASMRQGFGIERATVERLLRHLVAEVESLRRLNGQESNDE